MSSVRKCLECGNVEGECSCRDGFKIIFLFGKPVSKAQMDEHNSRDPLTKKVIELAWIQEKVGSVDDTDIR